MLRIFMGFLFLNTYVFAQNNLITTSSDAYNNLYSNIIHPSLVNKLYQLNENKLIWFLPGEQSGFLREILKNKIDSSENIGLQKNKYHFNELNRNVGKNFPPEDTAAAMQMDRIFTDAAIAYCKDVYQGEDVDSWITYDELSKKYEDADNNYLLKNLLVIRTSDNLPDFLGSLEPNDKEYLLLKMNYESGQIL